MKKKLVMYALTFAAVFMFSMSTANAWYLSLETLGEVEVGDTFTANLYFNSDEGGNSVRGYKFAIGYDTDELDWVSETAASQVATPFSNTKVYEPEEDDDGLIENWKALNKSGESIVGQVLLASIEFTVLDGASWDETVDVWLDDTYQFITVDGVSYYIEDGDGEITYFQGPDVGSAAVPVPGAGLLLGAGLFSLVGIGRRKTRD